MNNIYKEINILEIDEKVVDINKYSGKLRLSGIPPKDTNWLGELDAGTVFLCRPKGSNQCFLLQFHIIFQTDTYTLLLDNVNEEKRIYTETSKFSEQMELFEVQGRKVKDEG